jgi:hypothetical protein
MMRTLASPVLVLYISYSLRGSVWWFGYYNSIMSSSDDFDSILSKSHNHFSQLHQESAVLVRFLFDLVL